METIIFFGLIIPIFIFVLYLGGRAIMTGYNAKSSNRSNLENETTEDKEDSQNLSTEINKLNNLLKDGVLTQEEFEKAKKKLLDD